MAESPVMLAGYFSQTNVGSCMAELQTLHATAKTFPMIHKKAADFGGTCKYPVTPAAFRLRPSPPAAVQGHMVGAQHLTGRRSGPFPSGRMSLMSSQPDFQITFSFCSNDNIFYLFPHQHPTIWHKLTQITTFNKKKITSSHQLLQQLKTQWKATF